jgi:putative membrane protein
MLGSILMILVTAVSLLVVDYIFPGIKLASFPVAIIAGIVIGLVNTLIKPIIFILSLPATILTLGAFMLVVNGLCLWIASILVPGFAVHGVIAFIFAPIILSFVNTILAKFVVERFSASPATPE